MPTSITAYKVKAARYFPTSTAPSRTGYVRSSSIVPERRSSANSRMVTSGMSRSRITLMLPKSGRMTLSVTLRSRPPICCWRAICMDARAKPWKIAEKNRPAISRKIVRTM